jgi:hypothetical protein
MMKPLKNGDKSMTPSGYPGTRNSGFRREPAMKKIILLAAVVVLLPLSLARAETQAAPAPSTAPTSSGNRILPPDVLVKNVLLPAWRAGFAKEVKNWHKKGAAILEGASIKEEGQDSLAEALCQEKERAAPPERDHPFCSTCL